MVESDNLRYTKIALNNGSGAIPALGFGTLIPDPMTTRTATKAALEAGFRQLDASARYRARGGDSPGMRRRPLFGCPVESSAHGQGWSEAPMQGVATGDPGNPSS
jgi:hypothetical protein